MTAHKLWSGSDLTLLPWESSASILMRFAWRNALNPKDTKRIVCGKQLSMFSNSFLDLNWLTNNRLGRDFGWQFPSTEEISTLTIFKDFKKDFFSNKLRICPICMECGYHTFWHQMIFLRVCPLHSCQLVTSCCSCGAQLPEYRMHSNFIEKRYQCEFCFKPIPGAEVSLEKHLDFKDSVKNIQTAFQHCEDWCCAAQPYLSMLRSLLSERGGHSAQYGAWCKPDELIKGLVLHSSNEANLFARPTGEITVLTWRTRMVHSNPHWRRQGSRTHDARRSRTHLVYASTLRFLQKNLLVSLQNEPSACNRNLEVDEHKEIDVCAWPSLALAYHLMRGILEAHYYQTLADPIRVLGLHFDYLSGAQLYTFEGREPRLAWRAVFLGVFATLYWTVERARVTGRLQTRALRVRLDTSVPTALFVEDDNVLSGAVFFPKIPGLPLKPYKFGTTLGKDIRLDPRPKATNISDDFEWGRRR